MLIANKQSNINAICKHTQYINTTHKQRAVNKSILQEDYMGGLPYMPNS